MLCDPELCRLYDKYIGEGWRDNFGEIGKMRAFAADAEVLGGFAAVKGENKRRLAAYIRGREGIELLPNAIVYAQVKRLHEYKRQLMTAFAILEIYFRLKRGELPDFRPSVFLFGAKSAPSYFRAKGIIKFINEIAKKSTAIPTCAISCKSYLSAIMM